MVYAEIAARREGAALSDFYIYLPTGSGRHVQYRFVYVECPPDPALPFAGGANNPANSRLYRIREAYIGTLTGRVFTPEYRALQGGEVSFAMQEQGAGDFIGGYHGDEVASEMTLLGDGTPIALDAPSFGAYKSLTYTQTSTLARCNTPGESLCLHHQVYKAEGKELTIARRVEFLRDAHTLVAAFMPMLTVERMDPADTALRVTDLLTFYDREDGTEVAALDTSPYGTTPSENLPHSRLRGTAAAAVVATGKESGLTVRAGLRLPEGSPLAGRVRASVWLRYGDALDSKVYFDVAGGTAPKKGTIWEGESYYTVELNK